MQAIPHRQVENSDPGGGLEGLHPRGNWKISKNPSNPPGGPVGLKMLQPCHVNVESLRHGLPDKNNISRGLSWVVGCSWTSSFMYLRRDRVGDSLGLRWGALLIESQRESSSCICFERSREDL